MGIVRESWPDKSVCVREYEDGKMMGRASLYQEGKRVKNGSYEGKLIQYKRVKDEDAYFSRETAITEVGPEPAPAVIDCPMEETSSAPPAPSTSSVLAPKTTAPVEVAPEIKSPVK